VKDQTLNRYTTITVLIVAIFAALVSYTHIRDLAMTNGYDPYTASILPLSVDGLIVGTSFMLVSASRAVLRATVARFGLWLGIIGTIAANVAYGLPHGFVGSAVSAWPAVAFIVAVEAWMQIKKHSKLTMENKPVVKPTRSYQTKPKSRVSSNINNETQQERPMRGKGSGQGRKSKVVQIGESNGFPIYDGVPTAYQIATAISCGHKKSVQLRQIMHDDNVNLETAVNIRDSRPETRGQKPMKERIAANGQG
jgi:Protein of unknown function (DUF2637)